MLGVLNRMLPENALVVAAGSRRATSSVSGKAAAARMITTSRSTATPVWATVNAALGAQLAQPERGCVQLQIEATVTVHDAAL